VNGPPVEFLAAAAATATASEQLDWTDYAWIAFSLVIFAYIIRRVFRPGGDAVIVTGYGDVEMGIATGLVIWLICFGILQFSSTLSTEEAHVTMGSLILSAILTVALTGGVLAALKFRGRSLRALFGFDRQPWWKVILLAMTLTFAAYPIVALGAMLTQSLSSGPDDLQEIVKFFQGTGQAREKIAVAISAVVLAPLSEELFFRGLIYGVAKKYGGLSAALAFNSVLFAFIHGSLPAFGGLFALAVCLTLAYELTGSLSVPIAMHACFNAAQLLQMFLDPSAPKP
jgi:uncharacterized protein